MSDRPEGILVRMLRWIDSGVGRLLERTGRTEQQVDIARLSIDRIINQLERIERRLDSIERRLPLPPGEEASASADAARGMPPR